MLTKEQRAARGYAKLTLTLMADELAALRALAESDGGITACVRGLISRETARRKPKTARTAKK